MTQRGTYCGHESCLGTYTRSSPNTRPLSCMPANRARTALLGLVRISTVAAEVRISNRLNRHHRRCQAARPSPIQESDTGVPMPMKQLAPPPVQEQPAPLRGLFFNFFFSISAPGSSLHFGQGARRRCTPKNGLHSTSGIVSHLLCLSTEHRSSLASTALGESWNVQSHD